MWSVVYASGSVKLGSGPYDSRSLLSVCPALRLWLYGASSSRHRQLPAGHEVESLEEGRKSLPAGCVIILADGQIRWVLTGV
ncbi:hypothetical protein [Pseudovibrio japonicus]|uniref:hypothetical protein n=1 Tax=Pseudovibrio japonicus TaxID=366534 RepID=UPI00188B7A38|nr:hypothetical protein [Pseudovibrio japonicus]